MPASKNQPEQSLTVNQSTAPEHIIDLNPAKIEAAFVADRISEAGQGDESFDALVASIREGGQQVPVLVRPHPDAAKRSAGWFQAAYGHRRIHATRTLGISVKAQVRDLSDQDLVLAQGKENGERRDLSFIERAFFAKGLLRRGFDRATVQQALSVDKPEISRLLQIADAVPARVVRAIGPAAKAGRPRWLALAGEFKSPAAHEKAIDEISTQRFAEADSDARFEMLLDRLSRTGVKKTKSRPRPQVIRDENGKILARLTPSPKRPILQFNEKSHPGLAAHLASMLRHLARDWMKDGSPKEHETDKKSAILVVR